ncbi:ATP-binding cassette domain-containing protein [Mycobacterium sp. NAZ190054]|uniref:ATP-binding cassette domain-containing protein n=1 Tax=Mycobacterium sp. NAZ190054 TaxID=1747766 RepID=UPI0007915C43|nr:ATP-binding cassette domain-containing protein [Mycobacterium sp. NAZ190054]KWX56988.1 hypothetical protein ASJ79_12710 [Mycobacterium sp. NAZ190054]
MPPADSTTHEPSLFVRVKMQRHVRGDVAFTLAVEYAFPVGITVLLGPSGAGKTTLLDCIAGLCTPTDGVVRVGRDVLFDSASGTNVPTHERGVAYVLQEGVLFPHLSVARNVGYGLRRLTRRRREALVRDILESFGIGHLAARTPRQISGGEQQRVALARSLVTSPSALLLDEPMSSLDFETKAQILEDLRRWIQDRPIPVVYVTHDHDEWIMLGERTCRMENGHIERSPSAVSLPAVRPLTQSHSDRAGEPTTRVCRVDGTDVLLSVTGIDATPGAKVKLEVVATVIEPNP